MLVRGPRRTGTAPPGTVVGEWGNTGCGPDRIGTDRIGTDQTKKIDKMAKSTRLSKRYETQRGVIWQSNVGALGNTYKYHTYLLRKGSARELDGARKP